MKTYRSSLCWSNLLPHSLSNQTYTEVILVAQIQKTASDSLVQVMLANLGCETIQLRLPWVAWNNYITEGIFATIFRIMNLSVSHRLSNLRLLELPTSNQSINHLIYMYIFKNSLHISNFAGISPPCSTLKKKRRKSSWLTDLILKNRTTFTKTSLMYFKTKCSISESQSESNRKTDIRWFLTVFIHRILRKHIHRRHM